MVLYQKLVSCELSMLARDDFETIHYGRKDLKFGLCKDEEAAFEQSVFKELSSQYSSDATLEQFSFFSKVIKQWREMPFLKWAAVLGAVLFPFVLLIACATRYLAKNNNYQNTPFEKQAEFVKTQKDDEYLKLWDKVNTKQSSGTRGIFIPRWRFNDEWYLNKTAALFSETAINMLIVDLKCEDGILTYRSLDPEISNIQKKYIKLQIPFNEMEKKIQYLQKKGFKLAWRVCVFADSAYVAHQPKLGIINKNNNRLWSQQGKDYWLDPYNPKAVEYTLKVIREASVCGVNAIDLDYFRFPHGFDSCYFRYRDKKNEKKWDSQVITRALQRIKNEIDLINKGRPRHERLILRAYSFGETIISDDMSVGQNISEWKKLDVTIIPMAYPHLSKFSNFGIQNLPANAEEFYFKASAYFLERLDIKRKRAGLWLEGHSFFLNKQSQFTMKYVLEQISGCEQQQMNWYIWDYGGNYIYWWKKPSAVKNSSLVQ